jgi:hypothetical protein
VPELPRRPEDLSDLFLQRASAGDVEAVVALYEPEAVLAFWPCAGRARPAQPLGRGCLLVLPGHGFR